jgi:hypothetical protein
VVALSRAAQIAELLVALWLIWRLTFHVPWSPEK